MTLLRDEYLNSLSVKDLLQLQAKVLVELKNRDVIRTKNNPTGDYAEWLVSKALHLELQTNSSAGFDAIDRKDNTRYQIKSRRITPDNKSRMLGAIRNLDKKEFDYLIAVIFDESYNVVESVKIPHSTVAEISKFKKHVNAHILVLNNKYSNHSAIEKLNIENINF